MNFNQVNTQLSDKLTLSLKKSTSNEPEYINNIKVPQSKTRSMVPLNTFKSAPRPDLSRIFVHEFAAMIYARSTVAVMFFIYFYFLFLLSEGGRFQFGDATLWGICVFVCLFVFFFFCLTNLFL